MADKKVTYKYGQDELDMKGYLHNIGSNVQAYIQSKNWTPEQIQEFQKSYDLYMNAMQDQLKNGTSRFRTDDMGAIIDTEGKLSNADDDDIDPNGSEYYYNDKGERITTDDYNNLKDSSSKGLFKKKNNHKDAWNTFKANQEVATYFNTIAQDKNIREKLISKPAELGDFSINDFHKAWKNKFAPGETTHWASLLDDDVYDEKTGKRDRKVRLGKLAQFTTDWLNNFDESQYKYENGPYQDGKDVRGRMETFQKALASGDWGQIEDAAREAGIDSKWLNNYLTEGKSVEQTEDSSEAKEPTEEELRKKFREQGIAQGLTGDYLNQYIDLAMQNNQQSQAAAIEQLQTQVDDTNYQKWVDGLQAFNDIQYGQSYSGHNWNDRLKGVGRDFYVGYSPLTDNDSRANYLRQHLSTGQLSNAQNYWDNIAKLSYWVQGNGSQQYKLSDSNQYYLPWTINPDDHSVYTYDKNDRRIRKRFAPSLQNELLTKALRDQYHSISKHQSGGAIWGTGLGEMIDAGAALQKAQISKQKKAENARNKASKYYDDNLKRSDKQKAAGRRKTSDGWKAEDVIRMGAILSDTASAISSLLPGAGQTVGLATGLAGTAGNAVADYMDDSISAWDATKNLGMNLVGDVAGYIPILGSAGKTGKIARTMKQTAPMLLSLWGASRAYEPAKNALNKLLSDDENDKMTVDDWRALAGGISAAAGVMNSARGVYNYRKFTEKVEATPNKKIKGHEIPGTSTKDRQLRDISGDKDLGIDEYWFRRLATKGINIPRWGRRVNPDYVAPTATTSTATAAAASAAVRPPMRGALPFKQVSVSPLPVRKALLKSPTSPVLPQRQSGHLVLGAFKQGGNIDKVRNLVAEEIPFMQSGSPITQRRKTLNDVNGVDQYSFKSNYDASRGLFAGDTSKGFTDAYQSKTNGNDPYRYAPTSDMSSDDVLAIENQQYYKDFGEALKNDEALRREFYKQTDVYLPEGSKARFLKSDGTLATPWQAKNNDYRGRATRGTISNDIDYLNWARNDQTLGARHNVFGKFGKRYFVRQKDGTKKYISEEDAKQFNISEKPIESIWDKDRGTQWDDYEVTESTSTNPIQQQQQPQPQQSSKKPWFNGQIDPTFLHSIPRAIWSDNVNRKIRDMAKANERALYKDPMSVHRWQYGDLRSMTTAQNAKADYMNQVRAGQTSDAAANQQANLEATIKGNQAINEGMSKDDAMQRQTKEAAWEQEKENTQNAHDTAMFNRQSGLQTLYNKGAQDIAYKSKQHEIFNTLWSQIEYEDRMKQQENKALQQSADARSDQNEVLNNPEQYGTTREAMDLYQSAVNGDIDVAKLQSQDPAKYKQLLAAQRSYNEALFARTMQRHGINYTGPSYSNQKSGFTPQYFTAKKGGKLKDGSKIEVAKIRERIKNGDRFQRGIISYLKRNQKDIERLSKSMYSYPKLK